MVCKVTDPASQYVESCKCFRNSDFMDKCKHYASDHMNIYTLSLIQNFEGLEIQSVSSDRHLLWCKDTNSAVPYSSACALAMRSIRIVRSSIVWFSDNQGDRDAMLRVDRIKRWALKLRLAGWPRCDKKTHKIPDRAVRHGTFSVQWQSGLRRANLCRVSVARDRS